VPPARVRLATAKLSLRRNRKLCLARPWALTSGGGLHLARPQGLAPASASEGGLRLARPQGSASTSASERGLCLARPQGSASTSASEGGLRLARPRARPLPRPREESHPRSTPASTSGGVSTSPDLGLGPTAPWRMHHYPTPSWLRLRGNKTGVPSRLALVTSNDGPPRASMMTAVLSPLRKQGDVSKVPAAPTAVLLQDSSAPPTATLPCTQGSGTSLPGTLAHSYTPIVHLDPLLASIKGRSRASMREGRVGERADEQAHPLSLANACNPYCKRIPLAQDNTSRVFPLVFRLAPTHLGWDTQRQF
jgi:hypothetical protein